MGGQELIHLGGKHGTMHEGKPQAPQRIPHYPMGLSLIKHKFKDKNVKSVTAEH